MANNNSNLKELLLYYIMLFGLREVSGCITEEEFVI